MIQETNRNPGFPTSNLDRHLAEKRYSFLSPDTRSRMTLAITLEINAQKTGEITGQEGIVRSAVHDERDAVPQISFKRPELNLSNGPVNDPKKR